MKQFSNEKSFTLVELLVSIFIIILLSGIIFANYRQSGRQFALQRAANKLAQDIRRAQQMAMSAKECPIAICGGPPAETPPRYGIEISTANPYYYFLYADRNDNGKFEPTGGKPDKKIEEITLKEGIKISQLFCGVSSKLDIWITFKSPDPMTEIRNPGECPSFGKIVLINTNNQTKAIEVNIVGLIEVK